MPRLIAKLFYPIYAELRTMWIKETLKSDPCPMSPSPETPSYTYDDGSTEEHKYS